MIRQPAHLLIVLLAMTVGGGCTRPAGVIFPPLADAPVWPDAPEKPRIRYVGQLATSEDLKPAVPFGTALRRFLLGREPMRSMLSPYAVCTDGADRLFVADSNAQQVHVFNFNTREYQQWHPPDPVGRFAQPVGVAWTGTSLLVADSVAACIYVFDGAGQCVRTMGNDALKRPSGLAVDPRNSRIFVSDAAAHRVVIFSFAGTVLGHLGERGVESGQFNYPTGLALDSRGRLYVSDSLNFRVQQFSPDLKPIRSIGAKGDVPGSFSQPKGIAVDREDHLYVVDVNFELIQIFDAEGTLLLDFGREGRSAGEFWLPGGIFIDAANRIWVADSYNRRVQVFDYLPEKKP